ncbi:uncharacterized protein OCT59_016988 [Rhizophagus irregularis]|uniref:Uncharacterized protein n=3 Tax=Rhizophagus irregularis TaxID=588596 RepID=A0A2I1EEJ4_9GLOM|nr:hypothetical protein GLOIN_2v1779805 [Rhizophagus irregularis DAOM 181602=DAOM 197198]EXX67965.1 hypothetical protein RirG_109530 [Rhizophagus irregularis DAOM 197198w]PKY20542.1 hypothetical protein RhiirB3_433863 [Rhizophagus irregularis]POG67054.1 hypothetical protein GLOIN_2v1779805 [Rhizophagus irregularis DAOM 181602=DAOM 197198]UZO24693.1 hypothetical protein OCT59_016988 [Rhizophagus irregularis]CAB5217450.1 unnamed protein product [Rhizophagus irregularis]|eukprot:XP_025173920.1 hypothetical protein GLOIN_2v1779805 [Rhizophagus irregularis DAOM 181602=DAOM 197198]
MGCSVSKKSQDFELKLSESYSSFSLRPDPFDELNLELTKQRKITKIPWIPYSNFNNITSIPNDDINYINYFATWKNEPTRIKDLKVILKELINSSHLTRDDLKLIAAELECNDKKNLTEVLGISQNPTSLNYIIVVDFLFSGNL